MSHVDTFTKNTMCGRRGITTLGPSAQSSTGSKVSNLDYIARWATTLWNLLSELAAFQHSGQLRDEERPSMPVTNFTSLSHMKLAMLDVLPIRERTSTSSPAFPRAAKKLTLLNVSARKLLHDN